MSATAQARRGFALPGRGTGEEPGWTVLLTVAVALVLGMLVQAAAMGASRGASVSGMTLSYPAKWSTVSQAGTLFAARDLFGGAATARVSVAQVGDTDDVGVGASARSVALADQLLAFHVDTTQRITHQGREAAQIEYTYVVAQAGSAPVLMHGIDTVAASGGKTYVLSFVAPADQFADLATRRLPRLSSTFHDILDSWRLP
jgi:hypothetical protein